MPGSHALPPMTLLPAERWSVAHGFAGSTGRGFHARSSAAPRSRKYPAISGTRRELVGRRPPAVQSELWAHLKQLVDRSCRDRRGF